MSQKSHIIFQTQVNFNGYVMNSTSFLMKKLTQYLPSTTVQYNPFLTVWTGFIFVQTLFHKL